MVAADALHAPSSRAGVSLRSVRGDDATALLGIYSSTRAHEMALVDWSDVQKAAFLQMQFDAQHTHYVTRYPGASFAVIERDGRPIGRLYVHENADEIRIVDVALLPQARGNGLGTALVGDVLAAGAASGRRVTIHVEVDNPARRLYDRLGFTPVQQHGLYLLMQWQPATRHESGAPVHA